MLDTINKQLKRIDEENIVWFIYFFLIFYNLYSNKLEKESLLETNPVKKKEAMEINAFVLLVAFLIYIYFVARSYNDCNNLGINATPKKKVFTELTLLASVFFLIGGGIALYVVVNNRGDEEVGLV